MQLEKQKRNQKKKKHHWWKFVTTEKFITETKINQTK
jgi:hypothetical protein